MPDLGKSMVPVMASMYRSLQPSITGLNLWQVIVLNPGCLPLSTNASCFCYQLLPRKSEPQLHNTIRAEMSIHFTPRYLHAVERDPHNQSTCWSLEGKCIGLLMLSVISPSLVCSPFFQWSYKVCTYTLIIFLLCSWMVDQ